MKIWKLTYLDGVDGWVVGWFTTKANAVAEKLALRRDDEVSEITIDSVIVPTEPAAFCDWANDPANVMNRDNG